MGFEAKVILKSVAKVTDVRLNTVQLVYPRFIHAELMTHREFSRNASSSRAIPVAKMIEQVRNNPAMPIHWGANQPGMQAEREQSTPICVPSELKLLFWTEEMGQHQDDLPKTDLFTSPQKWWCFLGKLQAIGAEAYSEAGYHKQVVNRRLEADQWMHTIVTTASFTNWDGLRRHKDAQPEIKHLADICAESVANAPDQVLKCGEWHLPYIQASDWHAASDFLQKGRIIRSMPSRDEQIKVLMKVSAARCARVSYLTHDGQAPTIEADLALFERLAGSQPIHASPLEHQATPDSKSWVSRMNKYDWDNPELHGNLPGWIQHRKLIPGEYIKE